MDINFDDIHLYWEKGAFFRKGTLNKAFNSCTLYLFKAGVCYFFKNYFSPNDIIVGTSPLLKGWQDLLKIELYEIFALERGDKPEKGLDVKMRGCHFFITLQFNHIYCVSGESKVPFIIFQIFSIELAMQDSHPCLSCTKTWYHLYISDPFW